MAAVPRRPWHSTLTGLVAFAELADTAPGTHVDWLLRRRHVGDTFGGGQADQLPARSALGQQAHRAAAAGHISTITGFRTAAVFRQSDGQVVLESVDGRRLAPVDEVVVLTGLRPDLSFYPRCGWTWMRRCKLRVRWPR